MADDEIKQTSEGDATVAPAGLSSADHEAANDAAALNGDGLPTDKPDALTGGEAAPKFGAGATPIDQSEPLDALPNADAQGIIIGQAGTSGGAKAENADDLGMEKTGPNDAGVTASGAE